MGMPVSCDLSGVRLKLARAQAHIDAIRDKSAEFVEGEPPPFGFRVETRDLADDGAVEYTLYAVVREQPPHDFAPLIGDAVHNIRSALDHLVYELAPARVRRSGKTQFPIFTDECRYRVLGEPMIRGIEGSERTLIERVQPWRDEVPEQHPLAILNRLSNLDKHRLLVPVITAVDWMSVWVGSDHADINFTRIESGPVEHDAPIVAFTARPTGSGEMTVTPQSGLHLSLRAEDTRVAWSRSVDELLEVLHHYVEHTVIDMWFKYGWLLPDRDLPVTPRSKHNRAEGEEPA
jgi:hypothetical protein